jgi:hypothetical protein
MVRFPALFVAFALVAPATLLCAPARANDRVLPMRFEMRQPDPGRCANHCRRFITASGAITADTPDDFEQFVDGRDLHGFTLALDSDGGSVLGAINLGRDIRRLGLNTTVGRAIDLGTGNAHGLYATLSPRADCQSMCAFVLIAGVHRAVPPEARVMVHQI